MRAAEAMAADRVEKEQCISRVDRKKAEQAMVANELEHVTPLRQRQPPNVGVSKLLSFSFNCH